VVALGGQRQAPLELARELPAREKAGDDRPLVGKRGSAHASTSASYRENLRFAQLFGRKVDVARRGAEPRSTQLARRRCIDVGRGRRLRVSA
jgi:hypothetical protein